MLDNLYSPKQSMRESKCRSPDRWLRREWRHWHPIQRQRLESPSRRTDGLWQCTRRLRTWWERRFGASNQGWMTWNDQEKSMVLWIQRLSSQLSGQIEWEPHLGALGKLASFLLEKEKCWWKAMIVEKKETNKESLGLYNPPPHRIPLWSRGLFQIERAEKDNRNLESWNKQFYLQNCKKCNSLKWWERRGKNNIGKCFLFCSRNWLGWLRDWNEETRGEKQCKQMKRKRRLCEWMRRVEWHSEETTLSYRVQMNCSFWEETHSALHR